MRFQQILMLLAVILVGCNSAVDEGLVDEGLTERLPTAAEQAASNRAETGNSAPRRLTDTSTYRQGGTGGDEIDDEDGLRTPIARALRDELKDVDGGSQEERDAILNTLKENDKILAEASGRNARRKILEANNTHGGRRTLVPPDID